MKVQIIEEDATYITGGSGKKYFIERDALACGRMPDFNMLELECAYEVGYFGTQQMINEAIKKLNEMKPVDAGRILYNLSDGIKTFAEKKKSPSMMMSALFLNTEEEDRRTITSEQVDAKIKDWEEGGIDYRFFLRFAGSCIAGFIPAYKKAFQSSLRKEMEADSPAL